MRAYVNCDHHRQLAEELMRELKIACLEIVPAGFNSSQGPLTPGSILFIPRLVGLFDNGYMTVDVLLDVEAFPYADRENLDERAEMMKAALKELFPEHTFAVWPKLVKAGWASDSIDPDFDGDMSMLAAIERARLALEQARAAIGK